MKICLILFGLIYAVSFAGAVFPKFQKTATTSVNRVIGGHAAERRQFPYIVHLTIYNEAIATVCGGSILSPNWVISAGHCQIPGSDYHVTVCAGLLNLGEKHPDVQTIPVSKIVVHPDFYLNETEAVLRNDIQLLQLASPLKFTEAVQPIGLPTLDQTFDEGWVAGWGLYMRPNLQPKTLQCLQMPIITNKECWSLLSNFPNNLLTFDDTMICAVPPIIAEGSCHGDSGGPLAHDGVLIGIVSWGPRCNTYKIGAPSVFTAVSRYLDFIKEHVTDI